LFGAMGGSTTVAVACVTIVSSMVLMWMVVPTEQTLNATFPNVVILRGYGSEKIDPISFDNTSLPQLEDSQASALNGIYQFDPLFYHKTLDRFIPWEDQGKTDVWSCTMFCSPFNRTAKDVKLALVHTSSEPKKNLWYLIELHDDDVNSPIVLGRSKMRKVPTYRVPWMTVTPGGEIKPRDLPDVHLITAWDAFRFDTPMKWAGTGLVLVGGALFWRSRREDDD